MRSTGKSYRALLLALAAASKGDKTYYVTGYRGSLRNVVRLAFYLVQPVEDVIRYSEAERSITFTTSGGKVFITDIETFTQHAREGRLNGYRKPQLKFVFDDCPAPREIERLIVSGAEVI